MSNVSFATNSVIAADFPVVTKAPEEFVDRRSQRSSSKDNERRQFGNSYRDLSPDGRDLAEAIDSYKVSHRRKYITTDEMLAVLTTLGYKKVTVE
jgi:hypothetical protein